MKEVQVTLTPEEIAAVAQRALAEMLHGEPWGVWCGLWKRVEKLLAERPKLKVKA